MKQLGHVWDMLNHVISACIITKNSASVTMPCADGALGGMMDIGSEGKWAEHGLKMVVPPFYNHSVTICNRLMVFQEGNSCRDDGYLESYDGDEHI